MDSKGVVLLSFDVEEFDMPLEYGQQIAEADQFAVGYAGFEVVMDIVDAANIPVTLFTTANFAQQYASNMQQLKPHHEIASHTYFHSHFKNEDLLASRLKLQEITGQQVAGLRMPRMRQVDINEVKAAGFQYDSSINPTWIPGRYNNLHLPRTTYIDEGMTRIPASVSPVLRVPLFWLSFKNFPYVYFRHLVKRTIAADGYVCLYVHPWEFVDLSAFQIPNYTKRMAGKLLQQRLTRLINDLRHEYTFSTIADHLTHEKK